MSVETLTIIFDLVIAIEVGMVLTCLLFMKRMSEETDIHGWKYTGNETADDSNNLTELPLGVRVYELNGPLFFGVAEMIAHIDDALKKVSDISERG